MVVTPVQAEYTQEQIQEAVDAVITELSRHEWDMVHHHAFADFKNSNYQSIELMALSNMNDSMLRSLGYLISVLTTPQKKAIPKILSEANRAAADFARERAIAGLNAKMGEIFKTPDF